MTEIADKDTSFEDAIRNHLVENRSRLVASAVSQAMEKMAESMKWSAVQQAENEIKSFFVSDVAPEIKKYLEANRETIIASVVGTMREIMDGALKMHAENMLKNLSQSYNRDKLLASLLGK